MHSSHSTDWIQCDDAKPLPEVRNDRPEPATERRAGNKMKFLHNNATACSPRTPKLLCRLSAMRFLPATFGRALIDLLLFIRSSITPQSIQRARDSPLHRRSALGRCCNKAAQSVDGSPSEGNSSNFAVLARNRRSQSDWEASELTAFWRDSRLCRTVGRANAEACNGQTATKAWLTLLHTESIYM